MKSLYESLLDDFDVLSDKLSPKMIKDGIRQFLKANYMNPSKFKISRNPNADGYYEVDCSALKMVQVRDVAQYSIQSLTDKSFVFNTVDNIYLNENIPNIDISDSDNIENISEIEIERIQKYISDKLNELGFEDYASSFGDNYDNVEDISYSTLYYETNPLLFHCQLIKIKPHLCYQYF